jgi:3-hydroxyacyl-[acyl-carrier-protein] dehydratase
MQKTDGIDITEIMKLIPHRYPFLLVDRVVNFVENVSCTGIKNLTFNESFFQGHFVGKPIMPGVLIIESMAQTASVLIAKSVSTNIGNNEVLFTSIENAKFKKPVVPGDVLELNVKILNHKMSIWFCEAVAIVDEQQVALAKFSAMLITK